MRTVFVVEETIGLNPNEVSWQVTRGAYDTLSKAMNSLADLNLTWTCATDILADAQPGHEMFMSNTNPVTGITYWVSVLPIH